MCHHDAAHRLEHFPGDVVDASDTSGGHVHFARIGLSIGDEFGDGRGRNRWIDHHDQGPAGEARNRRDVLDEIEIEFFVECRVDCIGRVSEKQCVAIGGCPHDRLGSDIATGACPVLNDKLLTEALRQPLTDQARIDVESATGGKANEDSHRPRRIGLRPRDTRDGRQRGSARGQMQKFSAGKSHDASSKKDIG